MKDMKSKTDAEWKKELSPEVYGALREKKNEWAFEGEYDSLFDPGIYKCAGCGMTLFGSEQKFDAHCGWPSFYDTKPGAVEMKPDNSHGMTRTEVTCVNCGGHLGHVFEGEGFNTPTDQRYCISSLSLKFDPKDITSV